VELERFSNSDMYSRQDLQKCQLCELYKTRQNALAGEGNLQADIMFIAQAPGELEDKAGKMFIGPSGLILDKLMAHAGIKRSHIYMTNLLKCILPQNRRPRQREIMACAKYLDMEIEEINPNILVPLGYYATKYLFQKYNLEPFSKKEFHDFIGKSIRVGEKQIFPLSHPASLLYHNEFTESAFANFEKLSGLEGIDERI